MKKYDETRQELIDDADDTVWFDEYCTMFDHLAAKLDRQVFIDAFPEYA